MTDRETIFTEIGLDGEWKLEQPKRVGHRRAAFPTFAATSSCLSWN